MDRYGESPTEVKETGVLESLQERRTEDCNSYFISQLEIIEITSRQDNPTARVTLARGLDLCQDLDHVLFKLVISCKRFMLKLET